MPFAGLLWGLLGVIWYLFLAGVVLFLLFLLIVLVHSFDNYMESRNHPSSYVEWGGNDWDEGASPEGAHGWNREANNCGHCGYSPSYGGPGYEGHNDSCPSCGASGPGDQCYG